MLFCDQKMEEMDQEEWCAKCQRWPMLVCRETLNLKNAVIFWDTIAGLYVFKSVYGNYVVGPTNVVQNSKEDRQCSEKSVEQLKLHIFGNYPKLKDHQIQSYYAGLRPRCQESKDYQIR